MKKPILVTPLASDKVEVITDFKVNLAEARTEKNEIFNISRVASEQGMIGTTWLLESLEHVVEGNTLTLKILTDGNEDEYAFRL